MERCKCCLDSKPSWICDVCGMHYPSDCSCPSADVVTTPSTTLAEAISVIETTADFYHSMDIDPDGTTQHWYHSWWTALDLLERIQGLPEGSLMANHGANCNCQQ